jgi:hypothetical protein
VHPARAIVSAVVSTGAGLARVFRRNGVIALVVFAVFLAAAFGAWPHVTGAVGRVFDHDETALRLAGYGWGATPWLVAIAAIVMNRERPFSGAGWAWLVWVASGLLLLPLGGSQDDVDAAVWADTNLLAFSWLCAMGAALVAMLISNVSGMVRGFTGRKGLAAPRLLLACWIVLLVLGGLAASFG